jgi:hypothetical protein
MNNTQQLVVSTIDPISCTSAAPRNSDPIDMSLYHDVTFVLNLGDMANETITATLQKDSTSAFGSPVTHGTPDAMAASATANDGLQRVYKVQARDVNKRWLRLNVVTGNTVGGLICVIVMATPRYSDAGELSTVVRVG